jgi:predicted GIY-YIG superfamily endonuclease
MNTTIYTLELEHGKYYVGRTTAPSERILKHFQEEGSEWTKLHKPIRVLSQVIGDENDEKKYTAIAIEKYGIDNVRTSSYCKIDLPQYNNDKDLYPDEDKEYGEACKECGWVHLIKNEVCHGPYYCYSCDGTCKIFRSVVDTYEICSECCCCFCGKIHKECLCREC